MNACFPHVSPRSGRMAEAGKKKRIHLTLEKKIEVIKKANGGKTSVRSLAEEFGCGRTQIGEILKQKQSILALYSSNAPKEKSTVRDKQSEYCEVNKLLHEWFTIATSKSVFPGGPQLQEKAKEIASRLGKPDFKASNGWLDKWKRRYGIRQVTVSGESGDVSDLTVESWKERLPELVRGYKAEDIWNLDETGCFWKALPDKGFGRKKTECKGGKKSKHRFTIAFIVNAAGGKEMPVVIWKSNNPRCFKGIIKSQLPVNYFNQSKAWMTGNILDQILTKINVQLKMKSRTIILMMDNAGCHPHDLEYSNIKIIWLPPNTTSKLQPLDLGIIQNFKVHYRKRLLRYVLSKIDECQLGSEVTNSINVLIAIRWVAQAWDEVKRETICKCFKNAGVVTESGDVVSRDESDPFADMDNEENIHVFNNCDEERQEIQRLCDQVMTREEQCSVDEYIEGDNDLAFCFEADDVNWDADFFSNFSPSVNTSDEPEESADEDADDSLQPAEPKVKTMREAIDSLESIQYFLRYNNHPYDLSPAISSLAELRAKTLIQKSITEFFPQ